MVIWGEGTNDSNNSREIDHYGVFAKNMAKFSEVETGELTDDTLFLGSDQSDRSRTFSFKDLLTKLKTLLAEKIHKHSADDITSGILPVARGGTGKGTALTAADVGAAEAGHTHSLKTLGAADSVHTHNVSDVTGAAPKASPSFSGSISLGRKAGTVIGSNSVAEGTNVEASGVNAHAEGSGCAACGDNSHAEGFCTFCDGLYGGHAEGDGSIAAPTDIYIPLESYSGAVLTVKDTPEFEYLATALEKIEAGMKIYVWNSYYANKSCSVYEVASIDLSEKTITLTTALPNSNYKVDHSVVPEIRAIKYRTAHAQGTQCVAIGDDSNAEGKQCIAIGASSHAEGLGSVASGDHSHAEGNRTESQGLASHSEGQSRCASGACSHAEGSNSVASAFNSHAEGSNSVASGMQSHAEGSYTIANNESGHAGGRYNKEMAESGGDSSAGDAFVIGNGTVNSRSNAFRVTFSGAVYGTSAFQTSGADYAEFFEWADENPEGQDRIGRFVTLDGKKIKVAEPGDYILGIISGNPCIVGNADEDWLGRWVHDDFGRFVKEYLEEVETEIQLPDGLADDELPLWMMENRVEERDGKYIQATTVVADHETPSWRYKANPDYDLTKPYIERKDRQEWDYVGMMGVLAVLDDGSCQVNGFCQVATGGIATAAEGYIPGLTYRVIERVADNIIKVVFR